MVNLKTVLNKIEKTKWWTEEAPGSVFLFDYIMRTFVSAEKIIGYPTLRQMVFIAKDNISFEITPYEEKRENFEIIYQQQLKNTSYFRNLIKDWPPLMKKLLKYNDLIYQQKISQYDNKQFLKFVQEYLDLCFESVIYGAFIECVDPFSEELLLDFAKRYNLNLNQAQEYISILSLPLRRSFLTQEKIDFYHLCFGQIPIDKYIKKYYWIKTNYREAVDINVGQLKRRIKIELKNKDKQGIKKEIKKTFQRELDLAKEKKLLLVVCDYLNKIKFFLSF